MVFYLLYGCNLYNDKYKKDVIELDKEMQKFYREEWIHDDYGVKGVQEGLLKYFTYWGLTLEMLVNDLKYIQSSLMNNGFNSFRLGNLNLYLSRAERMLNTYNDFELLIYRKCIINLYKHLNYLIDEVKEKKKNIYTTKEKNQYDNNNINNTNGIPFSIISYNINENEVYTKNKHGIEIINGENKLFLPYSSINYIKNNNKQRTIITKKHAFILRKTDI